MPQSGVYAALGTDMQRGWDLAGRDGGKFGDRTVETVVADEGEDPETGVPAVQKVLQRTRSTSWSAWSTRPPRWACATCSTEAKVADRHQRRRRTTSPASQRPYIWRTSFTNGQVAAAMGAAPGRGESGFGEACT